VWVSESGEDTPFLPTTSRFLFHDDDDDEVVWAARGVPGGGGGGGAWTATRWGGAEHKQKPTPPVADVRCVCRAVRCLYVIVLASGAPTAADNFDVTLLAWSTPVFYSRLKSGRYTFY